MVDGGRGRARADWEKQSGSGVRDWHPMFEHREEETGEGRGVRARVSASVFRSRTKRFRALQYVLLPSMEDPPGRQIYVLVRVQTNHRTGFTGRHYSFEYFIRDPVIWEWVICFDKKLSK